MGIRIPTLAALHRMGANNASGTLSAWARDLREELALFREGAISTPGSKAANAANTRKRLARVYAHASVLGVHVGEPREQAAGVVMGEAA